MAQPNNLIQDLLRIQAVQIKTSGYFTLTSGLKSPIYCDNRLTMSYPSVRQRIVKCFVEEIKRLGLKPDIIVGCATAGIPHAALLSEALNLPLAYVRASAKKHGKGNQIEGLVRKGDRVLVVEDLISTAGSAIEVTEALEGVGAEVLHVFAIFTYNFQRAISAFEDKPYELYAITSFDDLITTLKNEHKITEDETTKLLSWRDAL